MGLASCDSYTRQARHMVALAEQLLDTLPDSTVHLIDSVLRMPANLSERERMDMALLQAEALFGDRGQEISPVMDDDFFDNHPNLSTSPGLERAAAYYAKKEDYAKASHAALYSGFVQQHYDEKEAAMRSFKEAEQFGMMAGDSLTVARAEYKMGKMLLDDGMEQEALTVLQSAMLCFCDHFVDKALTQNMMGVCNILQGDFDNAEKCLRFGLLFLEQGHAKASNVYRKIWNNYAVLYRIQGKYDHAIGCLHHMLDDPNLDGNSAFTTHLNLGNVYFDMKEMDSAVKYYQFVETELPMINAKKETVLASFEALGRFAATQGNDSLALQYREMHEKGLYDLMLQRQEQTVYKVQHQFNYESLQNETNKKLLRRQHLITLLAIFTIIGLGALAVSQTRLARTRKHEAETNANLFHFMQQNRALVESNMRQEQKVQDAAQQLSDMLHKRLMAMLKLDYCLKTLIDKIAAKDLEKEVFGDGDHWEAVKEVLDSLYPGLWEAIGLKYPTMDEMERRVCMLSRLKLSRLGEATLLGVSTSVLDKLRTKVRKTVEQEEKR